MSVIYVSPTEPDLLRSIGQTSFLPERFGCDVVIPANGRIAGIQRKTVDDFLASIRDGRLEKEFAQMKAISIRALVIEGVWQWTTTGVLATDPGWTMASILGIIWSAQLVHGIAFWYTRHLYETVMSVQLFAKWVRKPEHKALEIRTKTAPVWGTRDSRDWHKHLLQGFPGIGRELAERIVDHFGRAPLMWSVTPKELQQVAGIGPKRAKQLYALLGQEVAKNDSDEGRNKAG